MTCSSCVARLEKTLSGVNGVDDVSINFASEKAKVVYRGENVQKEIIKAVENAGYEASFQTDKSEMSENTKTTGELIQITKLLNLL